jgi:putative oxidoreductase
MNITIGIALLILRLGLGLTLAGHGLQKLLGWFGGSGLRRFQENLARQGLQPPWFWASLAVLGEVGGGLSVACGLLTPLGAAGVVGAMVMAICKSHWKKGFWASRGGFEYPLLLSLVAVTVGLIGPGRYSLDSLLVPRLPQALLFIVLAVAALCADVIGLLSSRQAASTAREPASRAS